MEPETFDASLHRDVFTINLCRLNDEERELVMDAIKSAVIKSINQVLSDRQTKESQT